MITWRRNKRSQPLLELNVNFNVSTSGLVFSDTDVHARLFFPVGERKHDRYELLYLLFHLLLFSLSFLILVSTLLVF